MRRPRKSDDLSASQLLRQNADPWQLMHALVFLYEELAKAGAIRVDEAFSHNGLLHTFVHVQDFRLKGWKSILLGEILELEERLERAVRRSRTGRKGFLRPVRRSGPGVRKPRGSLAVVA